jgi:fructosamine-3-kinase
MPDWPSLADTLGKHDIHVPDFSAVRAVGGGDISAAWRVPTDRGRVFLKTANPDSCEMFAAEADGLAELKRANSVRVPDVLATGMSKRDCFLALEWLELGPTTAASDQLLGQQLAMQHRVLGDRHGYQRDNTIGRTPQINTWNESWLDFYAEYRLNFQIELAVRNGFGAELTGVASELTRILPSLFSNYDPQPSLLHGDLWGGNKSCVDGRPVIFDPAVYYGDRECDLAMTRLFGGFSAEFYAAYEESWPLSRGHEKRLTVYKLYHVLNHLNLFGGAYLDHARALIRSALVEND